MAARKTNRTATRAKRHESKTTADAADRSTTDDGKAVDSPDNMTQARTQGDGFRAHVREPLPVESLPVSGPLA